MGNGQAAVVLRSYLGSLRTFSRDVRLCLLATTLLGFTVSGGMSGVLLNLYLLRLGYGTEFIGLVNAMSSVTSVLFALPIAAIGRRLGSRLAIAIGMGLIALGNGLLPVVDTGPAREAWILGTYLLAGLGTTLYLVNLNPFLMDAASPAERNHVFSVRMAVLPLAGFAGSLLGGLLPGLFSPILGVTLEHADPYRYPLFVAALLLVPAVPMMLAAGKGGGGQADADARGKRAQEVGMDARAPAFPTGTVVLLALVSFLRVMGEGTPRAFFNVYLDAGLHVPTAQIGALAGIGQLLAVPAGLVMPILAARWGNGRTVAFGAFGVALSLLPLALIPHWAAAGVGFVAMTALAAIARSSFIVYSMEAVSPRWRATMSASTTMSAAVSWSATAFGGGYLIGAIGYRGVFLAGAGLTFAGALLFWSKYCRPHGGSPGPAAPERER